jgi:hypothetical protein
MTLQTQPPFHPALQYMPSPMQDVIDGSMAGVNRADDPDAIDPSQLSKLNLVTPDFPVGNGFGPEIELSKYAAELSPGLSRIFDPEAYRTTGQLNRLPVQHHPALAPWMGRTPPIPLLSMSFYDLGKSLRNSFDHATLPTWISGSRPTAAVAGAMAGGGLGWLLGQAGNLLQPGSAEPGSLGALGAALGGTIGAYRKPSLP